MHSGQQGRIKTAVCDIEVEDMPKCRPIARILAYTLLPDRAATGCPLGRGALADSAAGMRSDGRGSDWGFTAVHFYVAHSSGCFSGTSKAVRRYRPVRAEPLAGAVRHSDRNRLGTTTCGPEKRNTPELSSPCKGKTISTDFFPFRRASTCSRVQSRCTLRGTLAPWIHSASGLSTTTTSGGRKNLCTRSKRPSTTAPLGATNLSPRSRIASESLPEKGSPAAAVSVGIDAVSPKENGKPFVKGSTSADGPFTRSSVTVLESGEKVTVDSPRNSRQFVKPVVFSVSSAFRSTKRCRACAGSRNWPPPICTRARSMVVVDMHAPVAGGRSRVVIVIRTKSAVSASTWNVPP